MQSLKFLFLVFFFFQNIWGCFETDNRRRRSGYAIRKVLYPCFLLFSKYFLVHLVVWDNLEPDNRRRLS